MAAVFPALAGCQENARRAHRDPRSPARAPDDARLPPRGDGRRRPRAAPRRLRSGAVRAASSATRPSPRRSPTRSSTAGPTPSSTTRRSRSGARAPSRSGAGCPRRRATRAARPRRDRPGPRGGAPRLPQRRGAPRPPARAGRPAPRAGLRGLVRRARRDRAGRERCARRTGPLWCAAEQRPRVSALFPGARDRARRARARRESPPPADEEEARVYTVRGHLARLGPCTAAELAARTGLAETAVPRPPGPARGGRLRPAGAVRSRAGQAAEEFCERRLLARIHRYTTDRLRREIEPVTAQDLLRFLLRWQHVAPGHPARGAAGPPGRDRAAAGLRDRGGLLGAVGAAGARPGLPARMARRALPVGRTSPGRGSPSAALRPATPARRRAAAA